MGFNDTGEQAYPGINTPDTIRRRKNAREHAANAAMVLAGAVIATGAVAYAKSHQPDTAAKQAAFVKDVNAHPDKYAEFFPKPNEGEPAFIDDINNAPGADTAVIEHDVDLQVTSTGGLQSAGFAVEKSALGEMPAAQMPKVQTPFVNPNQQ
jgi:hypothetical protein